MQVPRQKEQAQLPEFQQRSRLCASHLRPDWGALPSKGHDSVVDSFGVLKEHKSLAANAGLAGDLHSDVRDGDRELLESSSSRRRSSGSSLLGLRDWALHEC